ncbi:hypothetical protein B0H19DRAFT_1240499 [Mycena capillaripes]|nr:hypothetical protein B0H19DRAFT_1240499 [Mycena capillaripes]
MTILLTTKMSSDSPLDPGVPARKHGSFCKFCMCISLVLFGLILATFIYQLGKTLSFPQVSHSRIYQNQTLEEVTNRATIVRPLVDENQRFEIAVSIWAPSVDESGSFKSSGASETPLYSDIVFRGLRLADKHKSANLTYRLPTTIFKRLALKDNDLRASFVLIPTSHSLMDQVTDFSTWRPESLAIPPVRSWPFPLGAADNGQQSVADRALDSFGISMPLLEFHELGSKCASSSNPETPSVENEITHNQNDDDDDEDGDGEVQRQTVAKAHVATAPLGISDIALYPEHALKRHPFVVTRTQIRVVDETHIFNRKLYNKEHSKLRSISCGQTRYGWPILRLCDRTYTKNGNWETRLELKVTDEDTGEPLTEWAYAPYIGYAASSAGPKDITAVPVTRENCTQFENASSTDPDFININWQLSYSGRSPLKYLSADLIVRPKRPPYNETEYKKAQEHDAAELWNGLVGHRFYEDAHPRRRILIESLMYVLHLVEVLLDMSYWYTRTSTVCISISGTILLALGEILGAIGSAVNTAELKKAEFSGSEWLLWLLIVVILAATLLLPFSMLKTVTRLAFSWDKSRWIPAVRRVSPTHMERASQRLDLRTSWGVKAAVCITLIAIDYAFSPFDYHLIAPLHPTPGPTDSIYSSNLFIQAYIFIWFPLKITGELSHYKLTVTLRCIYAGLRLLKYLPFVVGRYDARPGLSILAVINLTVLMVFAWQAAIFPKVTPKMEKDSE